MRLRKNALKIERWPSNGHFRPILDLCQNRKNRFVANFILYKSRIGNFLLVSIPNEEKNILRFFRYKKSHNTKVLRFLIPYDIKTGRF